MNPKQIKRVQIFIIIFLSCLTLYVLFKEVKKSQARRENQKQEANSPTSAKPEKTPGKESAPKPAPTPEARRKPLTPKQKETLENFRRQGEIILDKLPIKSDLQKLEENQVHSIPQELLKTGRELGKLKELVIKYPDFKELQDEAKSYYKNCADQDQYPTSIRSLCLFNRLQLAKNHNEEFDLSPYPLEIKQLVLELAPFRKQ